jgi:lipopolysaccharide exporter
MATALPFLPFRSVFRIRQLAELRKGTFISNVLLVMSGTGVGQLLTFGFAPVLSRLYRPAEFGMADSFFALAMILGAVVTLQYSQAVMLPRREEVALQVLVLSFAVALVAAAGFWVALAALESFRPNLTAQFKGWIWLAPLAGLVAGTNQSLTTWCARRKEFRRTAASQVVRSIAAGGGQTMGALCGLGGGGLIAGGLMGEVLGWLALWRSAGRAGCVNLGKAVSWGQLKSAARQYRDFPLYSTPQFLANAISQGAPVLLLTYYFGAAAGGFYAFAVRVLQAPMNLVLTALRQVLFQKLTQVHHDGGDLLGFFTRSTGALLALGLLPALVGFCLAPQAFAFVFGDRWLTAGEYARWLLLWLLPAFCNVPANLLTRVLRRQRALLVYDTVLLAARLVVLVVGGTCLTCLQTIVAFSVVGVIFNSWLIYYMWRVISNGAGTDSVSPSPAQDAACAESLT